jgi:hypothetical protein
MLKNKYLNSWYLFLLITVPVSLAVLIMMTTVELSTATGVSVMIQFSVRLAVPLLYLAFVASSLHILFPSAFTRWLLRNRKFIGLSFAAAMAWQLLFILWLVTVHSDYYINEVYVLRDAIEGVVGYLLLAAMTITSFNFGRNQLSLRSWQWLHKGGIYFLWAYAYTVYWWEIFYYAEPEALDYVYYWAGFAACALRAAAWSNKRRKLMGRGTPPVVVPGVFKMMGLSIAASGILVAVFTPMWRQLSEDLLTGYAVTYIPETYLPYWPFEPFIPLFIIAFGAYMTTRGRQSSVGK